MTYGYLSGPEIYEFTRDLGKVISVLNWSDKRVLAHLDFRCHAQYGCCFEFNYNIAKHVGFSERTVRTSKKRLLNLNLIKKINIRIGRFKKTAYILTELGKIIINLLLKRIEIKDIINRIIKDIGNKVSINPISNIFNNIFRNILGSNGRQNGRDVGRDSGKEVEKSNKKVEEVKREVNNSENTQKIPDKCENRFTNSGLCRIGDSKEFKEICKTFGGTSDINKSSDCKKKDLTLGEYQDEKWWRIRKSLKKMRDAGIPIPQDLIDKYRLNEILKGDEERQ